MVADGTVSSRSAHQRTDAGPAVKQGSITPTGAPHRLRPRDHRPRRHTEPTRNHAECPVTRLLSPGRCAPCPTRTDRPDRRPPLAGTHRASRSTTVAHRRGQTGSAATPCRPGDGAGPQRRRGRSFERRVDPAALGYPLAAFVTTQVASADSTRWHGPCPRSPRWCKWTGCPASVTCWCTSWRPTPTTCTAWRTHPRHPRVERTSTALVMRRLVPYRIAPLLRRRTAGS